MCNNSFKGQPGISIYSPEYQRTTYKLGQQMSGSNLMNMMDTNTSDSFNLNKSKQAPLSSTSNTTNILLNSHLANSNNNSATSPINGF